VKPGDIVAIVGAGPVGLAALLTAQLYSPAEIVMVDLDDNRLKVARSFGATKTVNSSDGRAAERVMSLTQNAGVDVAIEAVGLPATFDSLTIRARCSPIELSQALDTLPKEASAGIDERFLPKFAECIPASLLALFASQRLYDWSAANEVCHLPVVHTFESN